MSRETARVIVLEPRQETQPAAMALAPRPANLDGKVLGLFSNRKANARELLYQMAELVGTQYRLASVCYIEKETHRRIAAPDVLEELAQRCDVVVAASAD
jgi:hypothetical protein